MAVAYESRILRLKQIENLLPEVGEKDAGATAKDLLRILADVYAESAKDGGRLRKIQRDLQILVKEDRAVVVDPRAKPLSFRRSPRQREDDEFDRYAWTYTLNQIEAALADVMPEQRLEATLRRLQSADTGVTFPRDRFRVVPDTLRLLPAEFKTPVLAELMRALVEGRTLKATYRDRDGKVTRPVLHPQGALQRGPRLYLFALKNDEAEPLRMYALHRLIAAEVGGEAARRAPDFDLEEAIYSGQADFGGDKSVELELRVRGYVADLVQECPMGRGQKVTVEPEGSEFDARLGVTLPATGQLFRWLLGCGDKVEVVAPPELRAAVSAQARKTAALYEA